MSKVLTFCICNVNPTPTPPPDGPPCPAECSCLFRKRIVNCANRGLTEIPEIPYNTDFIDLSNNSISELRELPFFTGKHLLKVDLSSNIIRKVPSGTFKNNKILVDINLSYNLISQVFSDGWAPNLRILNLQNNQLQTVNDVEGFNGLNYLEALLLDNNKLGQLSSGLQNLTGLGTLSLNSNRFVQFPILYKDVQFIETLNLYNNFIPTLSYTSSVNLNSLSTLDVSMNGVVNITSEFLGAFPNLQTLDASSNTIQVVPVLSSTSLTYS